MNEEAVIRETVAENFPSLGRDDPLKQLDKKTNSRLLNKNKTKTQKP